MQRHAAGGAAARTVSSLAAMLGAFDHPGGGFVYSTSAAYGMNGFEVRRPDLRPGPVRSLTMTKLGAVLLEEDPPVQALVIVGANPMVSNPDLNRVTRGLARPDLFTVAIDLYPTPTTEYADIILPSAMQHDRPDIDLDRLRREGFVRLPGTEDYAPFVDHFPTPSGRFEFASERAQADGFGLLPEFVPPFEAGVDPGHRYALIARGSSEHVNSVFAGTEKVRSKAQAPPVTIHPEDAKRDGLLDGDQVEVANDRGGFVAVVRVADSGRPGLAIITKGWWRQGVNATVREADSDMGHGAIFHDNVVSIVKLEHRDPLYMKPVPT